MYLDGGIFGPLWRFEGSKSIEGAVGLEIRGRVSQPYATSAGADGIALSKSRGSFRERREIGGEMYTR